MRKVIVGAVLALSAVQAHAALPGSITSGIGEYATDAATIGGAVLAVILAAAGFKWLRRAF